MFNQRITNLRKHKAAGGFSIQKFKSKTINPSPTIISYIPTQVVGFVIHSTTDLDNDGYTDEIENIFGTDINDSSNFPVSLFNVFNNL